MPNQIYTLVNSVASQALGSTAVTAVDGTTLVSLGDAVLSSASTTEEFLNTLVKRIGKTIISTRAYRNHFAKYVKSDMEWGAILQKIKVAMPDAETDESYGLTNGVSVDMYKVSKPVVDQKLFIKETPYQFKITIQKKHLKEAFLSESAMGGFIGAITQEVRNAIEFAIENLGHIALCNMIGESSREIKLITDYKTATGNTTITAATALTNADFLRYAIGRMKAVGKKMQYMSKAYNDGSATRHTPVELQNVIILDDVITAMETQVEYGAFNDNYLKLANVTEIPYFQGEKSPMEIKLSKTSGSATAKTISNVVGVICDADAWGVYQIEEDVATTPFNAGGLYANTFYHERQLWFNDLSENFVYFTLA